MTSTIYMVCICVLLLTCSYLIKKLYDFSTLILSIEESIEESLDILDERYKSMNKILQTPIFFDSIEIRQVVSEIRDCHNAVLLVANKLTNETGMIGEIKKENDQKAQIR